MIHSWNLVFHLSTKAPKSYPLQCQGEEDYNKKKQKPEKVEKISVALVKIQYIDKNFQNTTINCTKLKACVN